MRNSTVLIIALLCAINFELFSQTESLVTFKPEKPCLGDSLTVIFTPGSKSPLLKTDSVLMQVQFYKVGKGYFVDEFKMRKKGNSWESIFKLVHKNTGCLLFQFSDSEYDIIDHNDYKLWDLLVYDKNGNPVKGAYASRANTYMSAMMMRRKQNMEEYNSGLMEELSLHPDDPQNIAASWWARMNSSNNPDSTNKVIMNEAEKLLIQYPDSLSIMKLAYYVFQNTDKEKSEELQRKIDKLEPKKEFELHNEWNKILFMPPGEKRLKTFYDYYQKAKGTSYEPSASIEYFRSMIGTKYYKQAIAFLDEWKKPSLFDVIIASRQIVDACKKELPKLNMKDAANNIEIGTEINRIKEAANMGKQLAQKTILLWQKESVADKSYYEPPSVWAKERRRSSGMGFIAMAQADYLLKDYESAEKNFLKAKELLRYEFYYPIYSEDYVKCMMELKKYEEAFETGVKIFENVNWDKMPELKEMLLTASRHLDNTKYDVDKRLNAISENNKALRSDEIQQQFKSRFRKAPDFTAKDLEGKQYSLQALKGKIVIIEFWNTSCGWCEKSAPYFQKFYNAHKNDQNLEVLSINCDPASDQQDKNKYVRDFIKEKKWMFPVLIDSENKIASKFRPGGVPVTFFIGPDSMIYYTEEGFPGITMIKDFEKIVDMIKKDVK